MVPKVFTFEMVMTLWLIFLIMLQFALKMRQDLLEDELKYSFMEKTDKEVLLELLKRANLDRDWETLKKILTKVS